MNTQYTIPTTCPQSPRPQNETALSTRYHSLEFPGDEPPPAEAQPKDKGKEKSIPQDDEEESIQEDEEDSSDSDDKKIQFETQHELQHQHW